MRIIPSEISGTTTSAAERGVFDALKRLPNSMGVALHSVHLPEHRYKRVGEIDFVLITPELLLFLEVKGGRISQTGGNWTYTDRFDRSTTKREGPFEQANSGMHELERELGQAIGSLRNQGVASGYLVITPHVDLPKTTTFTHAQYLGMSEYDGGRGLEEGIRQASRSWLRQNPWARTPIPDRLRTRILEAIRPDFDLVPNLRSRIADLEVRFERLTTEQYDRIDELAENRRLIWSGGAGTGKTFLAAEAARRKSVHGSVLFTCASRTLAAYVSRVLADADVVVLPFERLSEVNGQVFDQLIVDEAQDLMTFEHLSRLEELLTDGLERGQWIFLIDRNNQVLSPETFDADAWDYLRELGAASSSLSRNCRNTVQIVKQVQNYTGADIGVAIAGEGEPVRYRTVESAAQEAVALDEYIDELISDGLEPKDITVLSASGDWDNTAARLSHRFAKIERYADTIAAERRRNRVTWSSVTDFKGLENQVVCVIDLEPEMLKGRLDAVYVAWTRARAQLWIACSPEAKRVLSDMGAAILERGGETG
ncbi:NERD domain-containing protein [Streptomyces hokutonensis]|uniref:NERD domain-containing protein n=1 Tax=Streptomyces hokutonensis TaxID=1306990 RepID=UPI0003670213|nr:NERD domain-containing protein [Streptomyces hokutonensis]